MVDVELRQGVVGGPPGIAVVILRLIGPAHVGRRLLLLLLDGLQAAVLLGEQIELAALGLQRILDQVDHLDVDDQRTRGIERIDRAAEILPLVAARTAQSGRHGGGQVERDLGTQAERQLLGQTPLLGIFTAQRQRIAQDAVDAVHQPRSLGTAVAVKRHVVGKGREAARLPGRHLAAGHPDVAGQIAPRQLHLHPVDRIVHRLGLVAAVDHIDVIFAVGLEIP